MNRLLQQVFARALVSEAYRHEMPRDVQVELASAPWSYIRSVRQVHVCHNCYYYYYVHLNITFATTLVTITIIAAPD